MMAARRAVPVIAVALILGACGGDDSTSATTSAPAEASPTTSTTVTELAEAGADISGTAASAVEGAIDTEGEVDAQEGSDTTLPPAIPPYEVIHR